MFDMIPSNGYNYSDKSRTILVRAASAVCRARPHPFKYSILNVSGVAKHEKSYKSDHKRLSCRSDSCGRPGASRLRLRHLGRRLLSVRQSLVVGVQTLRRKGKRRSADRRKGRPHPQSQHYRRRRIRSALRFQRQHLDGCKPPGVYRRLAGSVEFLPPYVRHRRFGHEGNHRRQPPAHGAAFGRARHIRGHPVLRPHTSGRSGRPLQLRLFGLRRQLSLSQRMGRLRSPLRHCGKACNEGQRRKKGYNHKQRLHRSFRRLGR